MSATQKQVRHIMHFALRTDAEGSLDEMRQRIEPVLGCAFKVDRNNPYNWFYFTADVLGMEVLLGQTCGLDRRRTFQLIGRMLRRPDESYEKQYEGVDIDRQIIDLLEVSGAGEWRVPSEAEGEAEDEYGRELEREAEEDAARMNAEGPGTIDFDRIMRESEEGE